MDELGGIGKFFDKFTDNDLINIFADTVGIEELKDPKKGAKEVAKEVYSIGLQSLLNRQDLSFLKSIAEEVGLNANSLVKSKVIKAIVSGKNVKSTSKSETKKRLEKEEEEAKKAIEKKENRPAIKKGITYQEMFQLYTRSVLFDFCKENGLKVSGKKSDLIKRILAYLDGDKENTMPEQKTSKKPKKTPPKKTKDTKSEKEEVEKKEVTEKDKKDDGKKSTKKTTK